MSDKGSNTAPKFATFKAKSTLVTDSRYRESEVQSRKSHHSNGAPTNHGETLKVRANHGSSASKVDYVERKEKARKRQHDDDRPRGTSKDSLPILVGRDGDSQLGGNSIMRSYTIDLKGDPEHLTLRTIAGKVPRFRRVGFGTILGAPGHKIDHSTSSNRYTTTFARVESDFHQDRAWKTKGAAILNQHPKLVRPRSDSREETSLYICLKSSQAKTLQTRETAFSKIDDGHSETEKLNDIIAFEKDESSLSDDDDDDEVLPMDLMKMESSKLERRVKENKDDIQAWKDLIHHQEEKLMVKVQGSSLALSTPEHRALVQVKLSLYDEALASISPERKGFEDLLVSRLEEGAKVWPAEKLLRQWNELIRLHANRGNIWIRYLDFVQSSNRKFDYESCLLEFQKCLGALAVVIKGQGVKEVELRRISRTQLHVFLRLTTLMREAGFHELAEAAWQALLELHFFTPSRFNISDGDALTEFEAFWDSEVARVGEPNANGWSHFSVDSDNAPFVSGAPGFPEAGLPKSFKDLATTEMESAEKTRHPGRIADEVAEEDPFHTILFSDLRGILAAVAHNRFVEEDILQAFVSFCHLPAIAMDNLYDVAGFFTDSYLWEHEVEDAASMSQETKPRGAQRSDSSRFWNCILTPDFLFSRPFARRPEDRAAWILRALTSVHLACPDNDYLAEYILALHHQFEQKNLRRCAKDFMRLNRNSVILANAYALAHDLSDERVINIIDLDTKTQAYGSEVMLLWRTLIWRALQKGDEPTAIHHLLSTEERAEAGKVRAPSAASYLKVRKSLMARRDEMLSRGLLRRANVCAELLALLAYLCSDRHRNFPSAIDVYDVSMKLLQDRCQEAHIAQEELHQSRATFLLYYMKSHSTFNMATIYALCEDSLAKHPNNTTFMNVCAMTKPAALVVKKPLFSRLVEDRRTSSIANSIVYINTMLPPNCDTNELMVDNDSPQIRAAFEDAAQRQSAQHSLAFWKSFFSFEVRKPRNSKRARQVFFRGMAQLPWSKWYTLLALEHAKLFSPTELNSLWASLAERGFRVHLDTSDLVMKLSV